MALLARLVTTAGLLAAVVYAVLAVVAVLRFPFTRRGSPADRDARPRLSLLKPVRGLDPLRGEADAQAAADLRRALELNLTSFFVQDYVGTFEIIFGFQDPQDPAIALVEDVCARYPHVASRVVRVPRAGGPNKKASVLAALAREATGDVLVVSDQDMRVDPGYLDAVAAGFCGDDVGVVTCPYRTRWADDLGGAFEALAINVDFIPSTLVACTLDRWLSFALGATMAVRRETLRAIGGFEGLEPFLADDYLLGNRALHAGWRVVMSPYVVDNILGPTSFRQFFDHQLRWNRGYRVCRQNGYLFSVLMNGTAFAVAGLALGVLGLQTFFAWIAFRLCVASFLFRRVAGRPISPSWLLLVPVKDLITLVLWALAVRGNQVHWAGRTFTLARDGRLEPVS